MIKLTNKTRYGVRALIEIGSNFGLRPTKKKEVVANAGLPGGYLENILISLRNAGLVDSTRGANGGFVMRRDPKIITMLEIVGALQGPSEIEGSTELTPCVSEDLWIEVKSAIDDVLQKKMLGDLIGLKQSNGSMGYGI